MGVVSYYTVNGEILSETRDGVDRDYLPDSLGSTVALLDLNQNLTDTFAYWPYGEVQTRTGTNPTPFQFCGTLGYHQDSSVTRYVGARKLRNDQGLWTTVDPDWPSESAYSYANGSPTCAVDPTGNAWDWHSPWFDNNQQLIQHCIKKGFAQTGCSGLDHKTVSHMLTCIIGCEIANVTNPMKPDPIRNPKWYPGAPRRIPKFIIPPYTDPANQGIGPCRLTTQPEYGLFTYPFSDWQRDPCDNILSGMALLCFDIKNRNHPRNTYKLPGDWSGDYSCYGPCMKAPFKPL